MWGAYIGGIYPRSDRLITATRRMSKDLPQLFLEEKRKVIMLQLKAGLNYITDPLLEWDDMLKPYSKLSGIKMNGLNRFYENNTFYRKPLILSLIHI